MQILNKGSEHLYVFTSEQQRNPSKYYSQASKNEEELVKMSRQLMVTIVWSSSSL